MRLVLVKNWWSLVIRGIFAILVGIVTFVWPAITLEALVLLFGAYALIDGIISIIGAVRAAETHERWGALVLEGVFGIAAAVATVAWPTITALALVYVIAAWALVTGVLEVTAAVRLRQHIAGEWILGLAGLASIAFGVLIAFAPLAGALAIALWFGFYALFFGILLIGLGFRLRSWSHGDISGPSLAARAH